MAYPLQKVGSQRFVGESDKEIVHDTWHGDCEDWFVQKLIDAGVAVCFDPDTLDQALTEGYEYCSHCFDRTSPRPPVGESS